MIVPFPDSDTSAPEVALNWISQGDRLAHEITLGSGAARKTLLASIEGDDSMPWPPSPPIQEINRDTISGRATHFGVGRAGTSHWSVSVQGDFGTAASPSDPAGLVFQWACRVKHRPQHLGIRYRVVEPRSDLPPDWLARIDAADGEWAVRFRPGERTVWRAADDVLAVEPVDFDMENATIQWEYRIEWCRV